MHAGPLFAIAVGLLTAVTVAGCSESDEDPAGSGLSRVGDDASTAEPPSRDGAAVNALDASSRPDASAPKETRPDGSLRDATSECGPFNVEIVVHHQRIIEFLNQWNECTNDAECTAVYLECSCTVGVRSEFGEQLQQKEQELLDGSCVGGCTYGCVDAGVPSCVDGRCTPAHLSTSEFP